MTQPTAEQLHRVGQAEFESFLTMYGAATAWGTAVTEVHGLITTWSVHDDDPAYSCMGDFKAAEDPLATLTAMEQAAWDAGAITVGICSSAPNAGLEEDELERLGYRPEYQEQIWWREIRAEERFERDERVRQVGPEDAEEYARVLNIGYDLPPDATRGHVFASTIGFPDWHHYLVYYDGVPGSASALVTAGNVAQLFVSTTMPEFRGRGGQQALITRRLADARVAGCDLATSQTGTLNASPRNMERIGFQPSHRRWIYGKYRSQLER